MMSKRSAALGTLAAMILGAGAPAVRAQTTTTTTTTTTTLPTTHIECYRVKDPLKLKGPRPSWLALAGPQVNPEDCSIVGSFRLVCVPVSKTVTQPLERSINGGPFTSFTPASIPNEQALTQDDVCYRIKCTTASAPPASTVFIDQFGARTLSGAIPYLLCGPAVTASCGNGIVETGEACDDGANNGKTGDCCTATCQFVAAGKACTDTDGTTCTVAQCDGAGACNQTAAFAAAGTGCTDTDGNSCTLAQCDGAGTCNQNVFAAAGVSCPDTDGDQCTRPACDGAGTCLQTYFVRSCTPPATCNPTTGQCQ